MGYDIFEGNTYEGHTLIPFLEKISKKFGLNKPIVVADAGLLSSDNIKALEKAKYKYILGARIKNESEQIKKKIFEKGFKNGQLRSIKKQGNLRLILGYSDKRATKDEHNRKKGLQRLEKRIKTGKLTKANINNRGYNKYLKMEVYKELERVLNKEKSSLTIERSAELTHNMYQISYTLPESKQAKSRLLNMDDEQAELYRIIRKFF